MASLLSVRDLRTYFFTEDGTTRAVDGVSFDVAPGETLGIVGESGCGKSVTALSVMRLLPPRMAQTVGGSVTFEGQDLLALPEAEMRAIRGNRIAMIFQEPMTSLNPVLTIGHQIAEAVRIHQGASPGEARARAVEMLTFVRIPDAPRRLDDYPHQFSGGMRQRVMIAMALACRPRLLIADEPTTALDVTIQAQILRLMLELKERTGSAVILITHDLGVVAETCQRVIVMYAGKKIEEAPILELFDRPAHPYTRGLMASIPRYGGGHARKRRLAEIPGIVPSLREPIEACAFAPRCPYAVDRCRIEAPPLRPVGEGHTAACHFAEEVMAQGVLAPTSPEGRGRLAPRVLPSASPRAGSAERVRDYGLPGESAPLTRSPASPALDLSLRERLEP
jgi:peptide/nickel transport system ATP-binding protein